MLAASRTTPDRATRTAERFLSRFSSRTSTAAASSATRPAAQTSHGRWNLPGNWAYTTGSTPYSRDTAPKHQGGDLRVPPTATPQTTAATTGICAPW